MMGVTRHQVTSQQARDAGSISGWCWAIVVDDGPTSAQYWANASRLMGYWPELGLVMGQRHRCCTTCRPTSYQMSSPAEHVHAWFHLDSQKTPDVHLASDQYWLTVCDTEETMVERLVLVGLYLRYLVWPQTTFWWCCFSGHLINLHAAHHPSICWCLFNQVWYCPCD